jgi:hypothetical protein
MVNYSILVLSCDKYSSLWDSFFERLDRHWPNDSAQRYLLTNHLNPDFPGVKNIRIGDDVDWSSNLIKALSTIESEYVYILLEDVFINRDIDQAYFKSALACIDLAKPNYVNTKALPMPRGPNHSRLVREVVKGSHYRASLCNAFWKKEMLLTLLMPGESPWEFERRGSERSNSHADFYGTVKNHYWRKSSQRRFEPQRNFWFENTEEVPCSQSSGVALLSSQRNAKYAVFKICPTKPATMGAQTI